MNARLNALAACIYSLHQLFGRSQCVMQLAQRRTQPVNEKTMADIHVVICTTGDRHLLNDLSVNQRLFEHVPTAAEPLMLGFECHRVLRDRYGNYDYFGYLEDDLIVHDPWFFAKLAWFNHHVGQDKLLLPNRYEQGAGSLVHKAYVDGDLRPAVTARFQNVLEEPRLESTVLGVPVVFRRSLNPHSGCFFLNAEQMDRWMAQPFFLDRDTSFIGPLESAASLGIMRAFKVYKPALENANFLEIQHYGTQFLGQIRRP